MPTEAFLETFALASFGLGGAIFVLVAVLPSILPDAIDAALAQLQRIQTEMPGLVLPDLDRIVKKRDDLRTKAYAINKILTFGGAAVLMLVLAGLLALVILAGYPSYNSYLTPYYPDTGWNYVLAGLFGAGLLLGATFAVMFSNLVVLLISSKPVGPLMDLLSFPRPEPQEKAVSVSGEVHPSGELHVNKVSPSVREVTYEFTKVAEESRTLPPGNPELVIGRWWPAHRRVRVSMTATDTIDAAILLFESPTEIALPALPPSSLVPQESRKGIRSWVTEIETKAGLWVFRVSRPRTNWFNPIATIQVWEGQPVYS